MSNANDFIIENGVLKKYAGPGGDVVIPEGVTEIGERAFWCKACVNVKIPASVTKIQESAFWNCPQLVSVELPQGLSYIGGWAFQNCPMLRTVTVPDSVTYLGAAAFSGFGLETVTMPLPAAMPRPTPKRKTSPS